MRVIIEISDDEYKKVKEGRASVSMMRKAIKNGIPHETVTPQEPKTFRWCTDCREYDQEKHCCHRWSKVIRDTVEEMKQEQEPCEDAISRQAVLEMAYDMSVIDGEHYTEPCMVVDIEDIQKLQPVTTKPKTGRWIADVDRWGDLVTTVNGYRCDKCNAFNTDKDNYCPNCGCRMFDPQAESEDKR